MIPAYQYLNQQSLTVASVQQHVHMVICYKYPYDLHNYTAFEDTEVRFLKSLLLLQLNNH